MKLVPAMIGVKNPCPGQANVIAHARDGQMAAVTGHELDQQTPALLGSVDDVGQGAPGIQVYVHVAVLLMTDRLDRSDHAAAGRQNTESIRVVHTCEKVHRSPTGRRAMLPGPHPRFRFWDRGTRLRR